MIEFDGLKRVRSIGGGCLKTFWEPAVSDIGVDSYNVYIRRGNPDIFHREYLWANVRNDIFSAILRTEADRDIYLRNHYCYYLGVNAVEIGGTIAPVDGAFFSAQENVFNRYITNSYIKDMSVYGDGSEPVEVPDRKITKVI
jgi:hypothetical protein